MVNGRCGKDGEDVPLASLTQHLFLGFTEREIDCEQTVVPFDGREAMHGPDPQRPSSTASRSKLRGVWVDEERRLRPRPRIDLARAGDSFRSRPWRRSNAFVRGLRYACQLMPTERSAPGPTRPRRRSARSCRCRDRSRRSRDPLHHHRRDFVRWSSALAPDRAQVTGARFVGCRSVRSSSGPFELREIHRCIRSRFASASAVDGHRRPSPALFVGMVMARAVRLRPPEVRRHGVRRGAVISASRSRASSRPALTAVIVGGRIGSQASRPRWASMAVTEQIDAIRALGADPVKKLVDPAPRRHDIIVMPVLCMPSALVLGFLRGDGHLLQPAIRHPRRRFFLSHRARLGQLRQDYFSGMF